MNIEFSKLLRNDRSSACQKLANAKVEEWMNDGTDEVKRCLALWMEQGFNLGDDDTLIEIAEGACYL